MQRYACWQASSEEADPTGSLAKKDSKDLKPKRKSVKKPAAAKAATAACSTAEAQRLPNTGICLDDVTKSATIAGLQQNGLAFAERQTVPLKNTHVPPSLFITKHVV